MFQLSLAPTTFLNYCFVTSVEEFVKIDVVKKSILDNGIRDRVGGIEWWREDEEEGRGFECGDDEGLALLSIRM